MKTTIYYHLTILIVTVSCFACDEILPKEDPVLTINPSDAVSFNSTGGNVEITVTTNQKTWEVVSDKDWCLTTNKTSNKFTIQASENKSTLAREEATITITAGTANPVQISVRQSGGEPYLRLTPAKSSIDFTADASNESHSFTIETNDSEWNAGVFSVDSLWCKVTKDKTNYSVIVRVTSNPTTNKRTTTILVYLPKTPSLKINIIANQKAAASNDNEDYKYDDETPWD